MVSPWGNDFPSSFDVGTPGGGHIHFGNDGTLTLYGADGVTVLAELSPTSGLTVNQGTIQTGESGKRIEMSSSSGDTLHFFTGDPNEVLDGLIVVGVNLPVANPTRQAFLRIVAPRLGAPNGPTLEFPSDSEDGTVHGGLVLSHSRLGSSPITWDGNTLSNQGGRTTAFNLPLVSDGLVVPVTVNAGNTSGTANFNWPKAAFIGAGPVVGDALMVSGSGNAIRSTVMATSITPAGGTVRVDCNTALGTTTTFNVHVKGDQYT